MITIVFAPCPHRAVWTDISLGSETCVPIVANVPLAPLYSGHHSPVFPPATRPTKRAALSLQHDGSDQIRRWRPCPTLRRHQPIAPRPAVQFNPASMRSRPSVLKPRAKPRDLTEASRFQHLRSQLKAD